MAATVDATEQVTFLSDHLSGTARTNVIDRWIYVFTAATLIAVVLAGFIPDSFRQIAAIQSGRRAGFPLALHFHAALMGSFLLLLLVQTVLVATDRRGMHMRLGISGLFLIPAIVFSGLILVPTSYHGVWAEAQAASAPARQQLQPLLSFIDNVLLFQIRAGLLFSVYTWIALRSRTRNPGLHKRLLLLSITVVIGAAIARIQWLPAGNVYLMDLYSILPFAPMFVWDLIRNRSVHRAYVIWAAWYLPAAVGYYSLSDTPWWHATARHIMGV